MSIFGDVLTDLTGGLTESYNIRGPGANTPAQIINILFKALDRYSIVACGINVSWAIFKNFILSL